MRNTQDAALSSAACVCIQAKGIARRLTPILVGVREEVVDSAYTLVGDPPHCEGPVCSIIYSSNIYAPYAGALYITHYTCTIYYRLYVLHIMCSAFYVHST